MKYNFHKSGVLILTILVGQSCIEEFDASFDDFESAIVIEATVTDINEIQQVRLTRTYEFEADGPSAETNANVSVNGGGVVYEFEEVSPGIYNSVLEFAAQSGVAYQLQITTQDGRSYSSSEENLPAAIGLDRVYADRITTDLGQEGVAIFVDSSDESENTRNFRYEYEETYKIIAPDWNNFELKSTGIECGVDVIPKTEQNQVCFATGISNDLILASTANLDENRVERFMVRFMDRNNYIISHRYSIKVRQYTQSNASAAFYNALDQFSSSESLFSESQPGFLAGNVTSDLNQNEKVLGYFDVSSVSEERIFFNYDDLFPGEALPDYVNPCMEIAPMLISQGGARCVLSAMVDANQVSYLDLNEDPPAEQGPYLVVPRECGDCTVLGANVTPEFWTE